MLYSDLNRAMAVYAMPFAPPLQPSDPRYSLTLYQNRRRQNTVPILASEPLSHSRILIVFNFFQAYAWRL